ncbi:carboxypeptidase-like regulatory domain-containing protein [Flavihumibacter profundi]|uniref:carboxypeptidase-like regulatory domain-containing protein n=1 Tax=Flavihumibacter profundi TaxID=2716883 RepID=UPI001CC62402|nr:carboxypeptidase-like regulatory domain-containing protein [Flavihumibacter profundi]MBZ5857894.1 carboxypeptidase-like regulatory domain-containing protein [Flavihumibacter profundi]
MKNAFQLFFALLVTVNSIFAQEQFTVTGKVTDAATHQALSGASVFCQNTTFGVITNADGEFTIRLPKGGYDLAVSYTGYQSAEMRINSNTTDPLLLELKAKDKSMDAVTVAGSNEVKDGWTKYGDFFKEQFFGTTANAEQCELLNPEALRFFYSKKRNRLKILVREDLQFINHALGYKVRYQLDSMTYEYATQISTYTGYPFFETLSGTTEEDAKWKVNRNKAYRGSKLHFMKSWYDSTIQQQGFALERVNPNAKTFESVPLDNYYDSSFYQSDSGSVDISLTGRYRIIYRNEMPDPRFVSVNKLPSHIKVQLSILDIQNEFAIEENGYWYDQADLVNTGYWSYERMAEAVPYDYKPN